MKSSKVIRITACALTLAILVALCGYSIYMYMSFIAVTSGPSYIDLTLESIERAHSLLKRQNEYHTMMIICIILLVSFVGLLLVVLNRKRISRLLMGPTAWFKKLFKRNYVVCVCCKRKIKDGDSFCMTCGAPVELSLHKQEGLGILARRE